MKIFLLTHERELRRVTNTGALALDHANEIVERILWERKKPNKDLIRLIENYEAVLLYSKGDSSSALSSEIITTTETSPSLSPAVPSTRIEEYENIIIIDSTWQEAQKIFNKSPYLKQAPLLTLKPSKSSTYTLRRNQPEGGLCTIECIIEILKLKGQDELAAELALKFEHFNG